MDCLYFTSIAPADLPIQIQKSDAFVGAYEIVFDTDSMLFDYEVKISLFSLTAITEHTFTVSIIIPCTHWNEEKNTSYDYQVGDDPLKIVFA